MQTKTIPITDLIPDPQNANLGTEAGLQMLDDSLRDLGAGRSILVDKNGVVIAGNKTHERAVDLGIKDVILVPTNGNTLVAVMRTDLDLANDPKAARLALADNRVGQVDLAWNPQNLLALVDRYGRDLVAGLWSEDDWRDSILSVAAAEAVNDYKGPREAENAELLEKWQIAPGQVWAIPSKTQSGNHRLVCGDCRSIENIKAATAGQMANLLFTSPPYWVGMAYETQRSESEIDSFISAAIKAWTDFVNVSYGRIVINTGVGRAHKIDPTRKVELMPLIDKWQNALRQRGWLMRHLRVWAKIGGLPATIGPESDVIDQHFEHMAEFINLDSDPALEDDYKYLTTYWSPAGQQRGQERVDTSWAQQGVWSDIPGDASAGGKHIAAFPIELPRRFVLLYTKPGELILDPFAGSATSILASELTMRLAAGVELSPSFLAGGLERLSEAGLQPRLERTL